MNLRLRVISGAILAILILIAIWVGGPLFDVVVAAVAVLGAWEYGALMRRIGVPPALWLLYPLTLWLLFRFRLPARIQPLELGLGASVVVGLTAGLFRRSGAISWAASTAGAVYLGITLGYYLALIHWRPDDAHFGARLLTLTLLAVAACDISAYAAGTAFGRHRLLAAVSPKKTVEGALAGVAGSAVIATALAPAMIGVSVLVALTLGLVIAVAAQAGDLAESALKREAGVKDSSGLIPGHGGLLDRLDSLLFVGPAVYCCLQVFAVH
jgi:phosphatidate cytidylyltransferase